MKHIQTVFITALFAVVTVLGCASKNSDTQSKEFTGSARKPEILEHKGTATGNNTLPVWVDTYINQGIIGLEKLPDYKGSYCIVGESTGKNLQAAQTMASNFQVPQLIGETVNTRINAKFVGSETGKSGDTYGSYFEGIVDKVSSASYSGIRKINDWWVYMRRWDSSNRASDSYQVYVLYTVEKGVFDRQVLQQLDSAVTSSTPASSEEKQAIENVRKVLQKEGL
ncbi:MAG: hypothetical protein Pg6C_07990 [Treponemataceae bacterium]|nr:MAG: hypothetical protein Pg6C_07990 [Treponemataceae bacterium]